VLAEPSSAGLKRGERSFAAFLKPRKRLVHRDGRFPAHEEGGGGRKPRRPIRLPRRINGRFDSPFLQAVSVWIDGIGVVVLRARGNAVARLILPSEEHHNFHLRPRRVSHKLQGFCMRPLRGRLVLPEIVRAGEWRQSKKRVTIGRIVGMPPESARRSARGPGVIRGSPYCLKLSYFH